jgi:hypothetical protein
MRRQVEKTLVELDIPDSSVMHNRGLLVVDQHLLRHAAKVAEAADEPIVGRLGILAISTPSVKATRVGQLVDDETDRARQSGDSSGQFTPMTLQLYSRSVSKRVVARLGRSARLGVI